MSDIRWSGADVRTDEAQQLIDRSATDVVPLAIVSAMHLCLVGAQAYSMFDEVPARAYGKMSRRRRRQFVEAGIPSLLGRGLLLPPEDGGDEYPVSPEFGLVLAAMAGPPFVAVAPAGNGRSLKVFPIAGPAEPVRAMVVEVPTSVPHPKRDFGPLGALYDYQLMSPPMAAQLLAEFVIRPAAAPRTVIVVRPGREPLQQTVTVRGDGTTAGLLGPDGQPAGAPVDKAGLAEVIGAAFATGPGDAAR
ncbi:hypothetical protein [Actinoplanes sp. NPDC051411]|uniref:hypothetical protein n=1 Tax=Actinoplanes sp. NPDC051411 TaxID=3155522 RepID=UPI003440099E